MNLIGEHTDYNGGHVFPCALTIGTYGVARKNGMDTCRFYSMNFANRGIKAVNLDELVYDKEEYNWANYPMGVISMLNEDKVRVDEGIDLLIYGNIPNSSGLSSSASLEVLTAFACRELFGFDMSLVDIALLSQKAENSSSESTAALWISLRSQWARRTMRSSLIPQHSITNMRP